MKQEPNAAVRAWLNDQAAETLYISSVTLVELLFGIRALPRGRRRDMLDGALNDLLELSRIVCCPLTRMPRGITPSWRCPPGKVGAALLHRTATSPQSRHRGALLWHRAIPRRG